MASSNDLSKDDHAVSDTDLAQVRTDRVRILLSGYYHCSRAAFVLRCGQGEDGIALSMEVALG
jgi:hypothetical protein